MAEIELRVQLHPAQREVFESTARHRVLAAGRRWGKTRLGALECLICALRGGHAWWVAPTYPVALIGWRLMKSWSRRVPGASISESERRVEFPGGGWLQVKSADNPDSLRGEGLDLAVVDEAAFVKEDAWTEALRPALSDRQGRALFISTPAGRNWFWRLYLAGQTEPGWASWQFPTSANPHIAAEEIEAARRDMPERAFAQEYLAQFLEDAGAVFRRVLDAATATRKSGREAGHQYVMGVDWAKSSDYTVITVVDITANEMVDMDRFSEIDYALQTQRLRLLYERWRPEAIVAERNAMGEPLVEQLQRAGLPVTPFTTTNATKAQIIDGLALALERGDLRILNDPTLVGELQSFTMERLPSGLLRYTAPAGLHDDCVMSLALAWYGASQYSTPAIIEV